MRIRPGRGAGERPISRGDDLRFPVVQPDPDRLCDRVVMNPRFDRERDIDHVMHAFTFLKLDGCLTAIMSAGTEFRETRKSLAFRELMAGFTPSSLGQRKRSGYRRRRP